MQALPGSSFEVIEAEFFLQLLVSLLANPSRFDGGRQGARGSPALAGSNLLWASAGISKLIGCYWRVPKLTQPRQDSIARPLRRAC